MESVVLNVIKYILAMYPYKNELSASRLTKMIYLVDWKNALEYDTQFSNAVWHFNHYGPYIDDFITIAIKDKDIKVTNTVTMFGGNKQLFELYDKLAPPVNLSERLKYIVDFVINATKDKNYDDFVKLVYSTYPVISSRKYTNLDLVSKAKEYKSRLIPM